MPAQIPLTYPKKALLVEAPMIVDERALDKLFAQDSPKDSSETRQAVKNGVEGAEAQTFAEMRNVFEKQTKIPIDRNEVALRTADELQINHADKVITREIAEKLHAMTGADVLLRFRITDYGVTPKSWQDAVITFEVTSTLGIAAIAYSYTATRALAGVYLIQEGIEESAEAYAGFHALDDVCRPVRVEAELISLTTGTQVWSGNATGLSDVRLSRLFRKVDVTEREAQLNSAVHKAITTIVTNLQQALLQGG